jgi:flagellar hook protein FlgE
MSSFSTPLSGLLANEQALSVVSDNIANSNTQGFKSNSVLFEDAMNQASSSLQIGAGVGRTLTTRNFTQGSIRTQGSTRRRYQGGGFSCRIGGYTYTATQSAQFHRAAGQQPGGLVQG